MDNLKCAKVLAVIVSLAGVTVSIGWFLDISILKSLLPQWVTMKFSTALCFFFSGLMLFFIADYVGGKKSLAEAIIPYLSMIILLFMVTLLASIFLGVRTGVEDLFVRETPAAIKTTTPGRPSMGTMVNFILIAICGILTLVHLNKLLRVILVIGWLVTIIGAVALLGYIFDTPMLYCMIEGWSTAMAAHTAILFVLLGVGLILIGINKGGN